MKCSSCDERAVIGNPARCQTHFLEEFEERVRKTIDDYKLINKGEAVAVAVSGGKDSLTVLVLLKKLYGDVTGVAIDEGIEGYREHTLKDLKKICSEHNIPLIIKSYKELTGHTLDEILKKNNFHPCGVCGALRKHLLSIATKEFDVVATGHNMDDEAQSVLMNLLKGNTSVLLRGGPTSGAGAKGFTRRVKPLYFCTEKEIMTFAFLNGLTSSFTECPNIRGSYRDIVRNELNVYAKDHKEAKRNILKRLLQLKGESPKKEVELKTCPDCGEPCSQDKCKACQYIEIIKA